jgi:leucyl aminopeptidase (aminopeptidase T)
MPSIPVPSGQRASHDPTIEQGARNVVRRCLGVLPGERVHLLTYKAGPMVRHLAHAVEEAGAVPVRVELEPIESEGASVGEHAARLGPHMRGATATILLAPTRLAPTLSVAVAKVAEAERARHLHLLQVDERLLAQSVRADPDLLAIVNGRLAGALAPPCTVKVTSDAGTDLEVQLHERHPILSSAGRPVAGTSENLPAGHVYVHPFRVSGTLVADRAIFGPKVEIDRAVVRRSPVRFTFSGGRIAGFEGGDDAARGPIQAYLDSHANADRVGIVVFPTNYLVRSEIGADRQDILLPGMSVSLGYASAEATRAPYEAPVQMVLLGRKQTVEVGGRKLVDAGRFDQELVEGIDPFR